MEKEITGAINFLKNGFNSSSEELKNNYKEEVNYYEELKRIVNELPVENIEDKLNEIQLKHLEKCAKEKLDKLAEAKAQEIVGKEKKELEKEKKELEKKKKELEKQVEAKAQENLNFCMKMFKNYNIELKDIKEINNFNISEFDINQIDNMWGKDQPEKLKKFKEFIGKKKMK